MTAYAWPGWGVNAFELRIKPNTRVFTGPYTPHVQTLDFMGERWQARVDVVPETDPVQIAAREAFIDRLKGQANQITVGHLVFSVPNGTMRDGAAVVLTNTAGQALVLTNTAGQPLSLISGTPVLAAAVPQLSNTATIRCAPGKTLLAGDMLGIYGQLVRIMANSVADGSGAMPIEFQPRARVAWAAYAAPLVWNYPTANFMLSSTDTVPTTWNPGYADGGSFQLIEVL